MLNLKATGKNEEIILKYLEGNASEALTEKINGGAKTLSQCWNYITCEARKQANGGCACIEDSTVYGWAIHFFEEESINGADYNKAKCGVKAVKTASDEVKPAEGAVTEANMQKKPKTKKNEACGFDQISFDSLFG